jgi:hypothetical protein
MADAGGYVPLLGITPFPLEDLYVPVLAIFILFASIVVVGQLILRFSAPKASKCD